MRTSRLARLARLAQARAQSNTSNAGLGQIKAFDAAGSSIKSKIPAYAGLMAGAAIC
jgi:hypothetical protein